ncbi:MAG TPA: nuclear transport factor 2 family protein, partial [Nevskiaceae bacterium]|nr:nuclear transport factor 2 family protein [Nevskiaceae bacterium]
MALPLEDMELIRQLKYAYCRCIDTANIDELRTLFTEDASVCYIGGSYRFEAKGRENICEAIANGFHSEAISVHNVHHPEISFVSPTEANVTWYLRDWFLDLRKNITTDGASFYRDTYVKRGGRWLIQRASYSRIWEIVEPVTKRPNITAHYLAEHGRQ